MNRLYISIILILIFAFPLGAVNYYVLPFGNDKDDGLSESSGWATIDNGDQKGLLNPGDTVNILPGTYYIDATLQLKTNGTAALPIVYQGVGEKSKILDASGQSRIIILITANKKKILLKAILLVS